MCPRYGKCLLFILILLQMSTSDSLDELAADSRTRVFPAGRAMSSQVVQLTSTLKVVHRNICWMFLFLYLSVIKCTLYSKKEKRQTHARVYILHAVTQLLSNNRYVIVIALDFTKAFDTVRHKTLLRKLAQLNIPDSV